MKIKFIIILVLLYSEVLFGQKLLALFEVEDSYLDSVDSALILSRHNLKQDTIGKIYYQEKLLFEPKDDFKYSIYQLYDDRFLIISALNGKTISSNLRYMLPKNNIIIVDLRKGNIIYDGNIQNKYIYDIFYTKENDLIIEL